MKQLYYVYDLETLINFFSFTGKFVGDENVYRFEISPRADHRQELLQHLNYLQNANVIMVGYNSLGFDYPILHKLINEPYTFSCTTAYNMAQEIIKGQSYGAPRQFIPYSERITRQLDLVKLNHFDNKNRRVSLKSLEFAMRMDSVEDLPVEIGVPLNSDQMNETLSYNEWDVRATELFLSKCKKAIQMREDLIEEGVLRGDILNYSDVKIGAEYMIARIGRAKCFIKGSTPRQTVRESVKLADVILPKVQFRSEKYQAVKDWFSNQVVKLKGESRPKLEVNLAGIEFSFALGGVHASVTSKTFRSDDKSMIIDIDVSGMYVAVGIANKFYPEHLGESFVTAYEGVKRDRKQYAKGTAKNAALKLAGNGVYGKSSDPYSPFFDIKYTYSVTINGQLQILQLVEVLELIPGLEIIQANTDGITVKLPRVNYPFFNMWCREWERETGLELEEVEYSSMHIRDVNNYIAVSTKGYIKRKGAYWYPETEEDYEGQWHKDFSSLAIQKTASACIINGWDIKDAIRLICDPFDFMLRYKTPGASKVFIGEQKQHKTVRYYVSKSGEPMRKVSPPTGEIGQFKRKNKLKDSYFNTVMGEIGKGVWDERIHTKNKSKYSIVSTSIQSGRLVKECNKASNFSWDDLDWDYYEKEVEKLMIGDDSV